MFFITISLIIATNALFPLRLELLLCTALLCGNIFVVESQTSFTDLRTPGRSVKYVANTFLGHTVIQCLKKEFIERYCIKGYSCVFKCHLCCISGIEFYLKYNRKLKKNVICVVLRVVVGIGQ